MLPDQPVQPVGLLEDRREELSLLRRVVHGRGVQQARHPRLDRRERRPQVVRDRGEHRRAQLVGLGVELGEPRARVEPGTVQRHRRLARRRLQELALAPRERTRARRPLGVSVPKGIVAIDDGHDLGRPAASSTPSRRAIALISCPSSMTGRCRIASPNGSSNTCDELVEHPVGDVAGQELARQEARATAPRARARWPGAAQPRRCRPPDPTTAAIARNTTAATTSRSCSNWNPIAGARSTAGRPTTAAPSTTPAQMPPLTAAIVTASMKIATPAPWAEIPGTGPPRRRRTGPRRPRSRAARAESAGPPGVPCDPSPRRTRYRLDPHDPVASACAMPFTFSSRALGHPSRPAHARMRRAYRRKEVSRRPRSSDRHPWRRPRRDGNIHHFPPSPSAGPAAPSSCRPAGISGASRRPAPERPRMSGGGHPGTLLGRCGS